jgi:predicted ester cyclase
VPGVSQADGAELIRRFGVVVDTRDLGLLDDLLAPGFVDHGSGGVGVDGFRQRLATLLDGVPDLRYRVERVLDEGGFVAGHVTMTGTHLGRLMGVAPSGIELHLTSVDLLRRGDDGRVAERWGGIDMFALMQQLGGRR